MGSERGDEYKRPRPLGEGTGSKEPAHSEAPQRATASRLVPTHQRLAAAKPKAKPGHTRDGRPDCKQVVIGLVVGRQGFPICHEVFAGNTQDVTTLETMLDRLAGRGCLTAG